VFIVRLIRNVSMALRLWSSLGYDLSVRTLGICRKLALLTMFPGLDSSASRLPKRVACTFGRHMQDNSTNTG